jgi:hypothetical protein
MSEVTQINLVEMRALPSGRWSAPFERIPSKGDNLGYPRYPEKYGIFRVFIPRRLFSS